MPITREFLASIGQAFNSRDVDRIVALFHEDAIFWLASGPEPVGTTLKGKAAIHKLLADRFKSIPDMHWARTDEWMGEGDRAVTQWRVTGKAADGTKLDYQGCDIYQFKDNLIWRKDTYWKIVK
jgi:ketosteroid isomerase-like protein